jgi:DNA-binding NtrC family response regulator
MQENIIVIDDDTGIQDLLRELFTAQGYQVHVFADAHQALAALQKLNELELSRTLVISDLMMPGITGMEVLHKIRDLGIDVPCVLVTAHASVETAVQALKQGAHDYITKPINLTEIDIIVRRALKIRGMERDYKKLQQQVVGTSSFEGIYSRSHKMHKIFQLIEAVARTHSNVMIHGESGTGKEMVARAIHQRSDRRDHPFVAINCSAIPEQLLESELFGHKRGAFTGANENRKGLFQESEKGIIFLDEIGDMPISLQAKLLRVIQERKVKPVGDNRLMDIDVRIIAATHQDLKKAVAEGRFREDLYYRLCVIPIEIPPLRDRSEDITILAEHFVSKHCARNKMPLKTFSRRALAKLMRLRWPGNVRELENAVERSLVLSVGDVIDETDIQMDTYRSGGASTVDDFFSKLPTLEQLEAEYIKYVLTQVDSKKDRASEVLGINRKSLYRKEKTYGIRAGARALTSAGQDLSQNLKHNEIMSRVDEKHFPGSHFPRDL